MRDPYAQQHASRLRKHLTDAEQHLWYRLRRRQIHDAHFRRQLPIGPYIADFACTKHRLIIELDGGQHQKAAEYDLARTRFIESRGYRVLRFWNNEVLHQTEGVLAVIASAIQNPHPNPPPHAGEGVKESPAIDQ
jgi:very-short-patch-repair endonuclease